MMSNLIVGMSYLEAESEDDGWDFPEVVHAPTGPLGGFEEDVGGRARSRYYKAVQASWLRKKLSPAAQFWHDVSKKKPKPKFQGAEGVSAQFYRNPPKHLVYSFGPAIFTKVRGPAAPSAMSRPAPYQAPRSAFDYKYEPLPSQRREAKRVFAHRDAAWYRKEAAEGRDDAERQRLKRQVELLELLDSE